MYLSNGVTGIRVACCVTPKSIRPTLWLFIASLLGEHCRWLYTRSQADDSEARTRAFRGVVEAAPTRRLTAPKAGERLPGPAANAHTHITKYTLFDVCALL